jgi:Neurotransmitter-gated ion-channel ligand binding domain/Low-density lipoprotein receptor domain class A
MQSVWDDTADVIDLTDKRFWAPYILKNRSLQYVNYDNGDLINPTFWTPGDPRGSPCVLYGRRGYSDQSCSVERSFMCHINRTYLYMRGLCKKSALDKSYTPSLKLKDFAWIGSHGTIIKYNNAEHRWEAKIIGSDVWATSEASYESLVIGTHDWTVHNDRQCRAQNSSTVRLSLTACTEEQFNCDDGNCISVLYACDNNVNESESCPDGSDEINCTLIHDLSGYKKDIIPKPPLTEVNFLVEIFSIQDISTFDERIRLNFNLSMSWQDPRILFHGLWGNRVLNKMHHKEHDLLWKPDLVFPNIILKDFEQVMRPEIVAAIETDIITHPDLSVLYNNILYDGKNCYLFWTTKIRYSKSRQVISLSKYLGSLVFSLIAFSNIS